jgi:ADP-ribosylglycohydrolase
MTGASRFADAVAGCLLGGAVGETLPAGGRISAATEMTLGTAEGLIRARRRFAARRFDYAVDELWAVYRRSSTFGSGDAPGFVDLPVNDSKGCGGVMRVAPIGLAAAHPCGLGIASAALTHGHPSGYLAAGAAAVMIARLRDGEPLRPAAEDAIAAVSQWDGHEETVAALRHAVRLADREPVPSPETVESLGEGWVAEEALAIAVYCALTGRSFDEAVLAAANHSGDSDSTAAIAGNLLGVAGGRAVVPEEWVGAVAERAVVERVAEELAAAFTAP